MTDERRPDGDPRMQRLGQGAWALIGLALVIGGVLYLAGQMMLVVVPLVLALFPAALLDPVSRWLKEHRVPPALASLITILGSLLLLAALIAALVPLVLADLPQLIETGERGIQQLQAFLEEDPLGLGIGGIEELLQQAQEFVGEFGDIAGQALQALVTVAEAAAAVVFLLVALFFYLKDDGRIARGFRDLLPAGIRDDASAIAGRVWDTLGGFFRGQLFVALVDAVFIGLGLLLLGIPLALPLAVLIFFGGLFPIVGAFLTGALAVLVALADQGFVIGLIVLGLIIAVQQLESNVLEPLILGRVIRLHPLLIIVAVTGGGITIGILGAFLAVPIVASIARAVEYVRERDGEGDQEPPASEEGEEERSPQAVGARAQQEGGGDGAHATGEPREGEEDPVERPRGGETSGSGIGGNGGEGRPAARRADEDR